ncbi:MAG: hypothetical protein OEZ68_10380 [Gammaproteobacteria bacterium]|nr:hypothetical protein [Gammaproteobacteria bacterium]MDH5801197.1 hypothetical protein [Gammaproteobacteria bacterium]
MKDIELATNQIESILGKVISDASAVTPSPERYFIINDQNRDDHWVLGFSFKSKEDLRCALENGVCYQIHNFVFNRISQTNELAEEKAYIVFDYGKAPKTKLDYRNLHNKFIEQLSALNNEQNSGALDTCGLCGHSVDEHLLMGPTRNGESAPTKGWMICPDKECVCFRTWALGGDGTDNESFDTDRH